MEIKIGMFINDRYEILEKVGSGGMADVYKAKCHRLNRYVAIKILKQEYASDKNFVQKFRGEAQSAAGLSHPNIVNVYDVGEDNGLYFIVMELVEGITLKRFIERKGRLEVRETVGIAIQIAQGMEAAHAKHIIHRDIKPQNIIISREGKVKVTDFGIAKAATSNTVTQNALGSVHYLSPEQARGGYSDERSDIYSLGITMYEMLTGRVPFAGDNTVSVALLHIQGEAEPIRDIVPDVPESLEKIVAKCMQKKQERRYQNASELIADLKMSISNPNGNFVTMNGSVPDSPTRQMTREQLQEINAATAITSISDILDDEDPKAKKIRKKRRREEDDDDLDSMNSGLEKILTVGSVFAVILVGVAVLYIVSNYFEFFKKIFDPGKFNITTPSPIERPSETPTPEASPTPMPELINMPRVIGLKDSDAVSTLYRYSKTFSIKYEEAFSSEYEVGQVVAQYPPENAQISGNAEIVLTISVGKEQNSVPNVTNYTLTTARQALTDKGMKVEVEYDYDPLVDEGKVIRTEPEAYSVVEEGSVVKVIVSLGKNETKVFVPNLIGMTATEADEALKQEQLLLGTVEYDWSDEYEYGKIISQSVAGGETIVVGNSVNIVISKGPNPDPTPTPEPTPTPVPENTPTPAEPAEPTAPTEPDAAPAD